MASGTTSTNNINSPIGNPNPGTNYRRSISGSTGGSPGGAGSQSFIPHQLSSDRSSPSILLQQQQSSLGTPTSPYPPPSSPIPSIITTHHTSEIPGGSGTILSPTSGATSPSPTPQQLPTSVVSLFNSNPISHHYVIIRYIGSCGPENIWKLYDGRRRGDGKPTTIFLFEKRLASSKLHKPKRKETITEILRSSVKQLERIRHPRILQTYSALEESSDSLAFATEPLLGSLNNWMKGGAWGDIEMKYGFLQITESLQYLHTTVKLMHRNVCPSSIFITSRGVWKLGGFEFTERIPDENISTTNDNLQIIHVTPWTSRLPKMAQPNLDYIAPEIMKQSTCSTASDCWSLGLVIGAVIRGESLIQSGNSSSGWGKAVEQLPNQLPSLLPQIPTLLQESFVKLLSNDPSKRPTCAYLSLIKYFSDPVVTALQTLDVISMKDPNSKSYFYKNTLMDVLEESRNGNMAGLPRKLWFTMLWPSLLTEMKSSEVLASVLIPIFFLINESTREELDLILLPNFRHLFSQPKSIQATVIILENLHVIFEKTGDVEGLKAEALGMVYQGLSSGQIAVQNSSLLCISKVSNHIVQPSIHSIILPKTKSIYYSTIGSQNSSTTTSPQASPIAPELANKLTLSVLKCLCSILDKLERKDVVEDVLPILFDVKLGDGEVVEEVVKIYRYLLLTKRTGLSVSTLATRVLPSLLPQSVNPSLSLDQFTTLITTLKEMLDTIDRNQRNKLKLDFTSTIGHLSSTAKGHHSNLRHQRSSEVLSTTTSSSSSGPIVSPLDTRKAASAEDVDRRTSITNTPDAIWASSQQATMTAPNYLRVNSTSPHRRLSDNSMYVNTSLRVPATAAVLNVEDTNLPTRRHSSIGNEGSTRETGSGSGRKSSVATEGMRVKQKQPTSISASAVNSMTSSSRDSISAERPIPQPPRRTSVFQSSGFGMLEKIGGIKEVALNSMVGSNVYQLFTQGSSGSSSGTSGMSNSQTRRDNYNAKYS